MNHPLVMYDLAKLRIADDLRQAERDRLVRQAGSRSDGAIDAVPFRERLVALMNRFVDDVAAGRHAAAGWPSSAYRVSKIGLNALTRVLSRELAPRHIRVNSVCPGWVRTDMGGAGAARSVEEGAASVLWAARLGRDGPTGGFFRDGNPVEW